MTLPASGNTISLGQVNSELGRSATATIDMNDSGVRALFQKTGSGTTISMSDGWGKSNITVSLPSLGAYGDAWPGNTAYAKLIFYADGSIGRDTSNGYTSAGSWVNSSSVGASYWIRFTQTSSYSSSTETGDSRNTWLQLSSNRTLGISRTLNGAGGRTYTVEISSNSSGSNIVATRTGVSLEVEILV